MLMINELTGEGSLLPGVLFGTFSHKRKCFFRDGAWSKGRRHLIHCLFIDNTGGWVNAQPFSVLVQSHLVVTDSRITWRIHWVLICMHKNCKID